MEKADAAVSSQTTPSSAAEVTRPPKAEPVRLARFGRSRPLATGFMLVALALVPWTLRLATTLPNRTEAHHWSAAWAGFDLFLGIAFAGLALTLWRGSPWMLAFAGAAGGLLLCDAWFDILTSSAGGRAVAIIEAVVVEIPLVLLCLRVAARKHRELGQGAPLPRPTSEAALGSASDHRSAERGAIT